MRPRRSLRVVFSPVAALLVIALSSTSGCKREEPAEPSSSSPTTEAVVSPPSTPPATAPEITEDALWAELAVAAGHLDAGEWDQAETVLRPLVARAPQRYETHVALAHALLGARRYDDALTAVDAGLSRTPKQPDLLFLRYRALKSIGRPEDGRDALAAAIAQRPDDLPLRFLAFQDRYFAGDEAGAWAALKPLLESLPDDLYVAVLAARLALLAGEQEAADRFARRAGELAPAGPGRDALAAALAAMGEGSVDEAKRHLLKARNLLANAPSVQRSRAWLSEPRTGALLDASPAPDPGAAARPELRPRSVEGVFQALTGTSHAAVALRPKLDGVTELVVTGPDGTRLSAPGGVRKVGPAGDWVVVCDVDNDDALDLVLAYEDKLYVLPEASWGEADQPLPGAIYEESVRQVEPLDTDVDGDLDFVVLTTAGELRVLRNNLDGTFRAGDPLATGARAFASTDLDGDGAPDLVAAGESEVTFLLNGVREGFATLGTVAVNAQLLRPAGARYVGRRGAGTVVAVDAAGAARRLFAEVSTGGRLVPRDTAWGAFGCRPADIATTDLDGDGRVDLAATCEGAKSELRVLWGGGADATTVGLDAAATRILAVDGDGDLDPDLVVYGGGAPPRLVENTSTTHRFVLTLRGTKDNHNGVGTRIAVFAGAVHSHRYVTALGPDVLLGRGGAVLTVGIGSRAKADRVLAQWSNDTWQQSLRPDEPAVTFEQPKDQLGSCPNLYLARNGGLHYVTDILVNSPLGLPTADGKFWVPDGDEHVALPTAAAEALEGEGLRLEIGEDMREVIYFDTIHLVRVRHAPDVTVYTTQRNTAPPPDAEVIAVADEQAPVRATNQRGQDITAALAAVDARYVDHLDALVFPGMCEPHAITFELPPAQGDGLRALVLSGASALTDVGEYALSQTSGIPQIPPVLEARSADGTWRAVNVDIGMPAGRRKTYAVPLPADASGTALRIRTNFCIFWDYVAVGRLRPEAIAEVREVVPAKAQLFRRGYARTDPTTEVPAPWDASKLVPRRGFDFARGFYTRYGDVTPLLGGLDDQLVIFSHGDGLRLDFESSPRPEGERTTLFLRVRGWAKDGDPKTAFGATVDPLPYMAMPGYPYSGDHPRVDDPAFERYRRTWNTRWLDERGSELVFAAD